MNSARQVPPPPPPPPQNPDIKSTENRIIHGDNLEALKALLPEFESRIDCVYIDPPYNTGNENWVYNDAVNDPRILRWLNKTVGKEGEDFSRHDKWLCMMYPRLKLLRRLLAENGVFLSSIDENEYHAYKLLLDEVFGSASYVGTITWKTRNTDNRISTRLSTDHEFVLVYSKSGIRGRLIDRSNFQNQDNDPRGPYVTDPLIGIATAEDRPNLHFPVTNPTTGDIYEPDPSRGWRTDRDGFDRLLNENRVWWPPNPTSGKPRKKRFLSETAERMPVSSFWADTRGQTGADELDRIMGQRVFAFPKSLDFMCRLLDVACHANSIVLDSFAGSGTTAHAVLKLNAEDNGNRRFILVEMMDYAESITAERVRRVMDGYGEGDKRVPGLGGGFAFYAVGQHALFDDDGHLNPAVDMDTMRRYLAYTEGLPAGAVVGCDNPVGPAYVGDHDGRALLFHYQPQAATTLDYAFLSTLAFDAATRPERLVVYADYCTLGEDFLTDARIVFKKIPRDLTRL